jgi:DNA primase
MCDVMENKPGILSVMEREDIVLKRRGRDYWTNCPFHIDRSPSLKISIERQRWHCFGCNAGGDVIDFIMNLKGFCFNDALKYLGMNNGKPAPPDPEVERRRKIQRQYSEAITSLYDSLCQRSRELQKLRLLVKNTPALTDAGAILFAQRMGILAEIDWKLDILLEGTVEDHIELLKESKGNGSENIKCRAA